MAKKTPVARITDKEFDSPDEAAAWVSSIFNPLSIEDDREFGGAILKNPKSGKFYVTYNPGEEGQVDIRVLKPKDHELTAFWHTHGASGGSRNRYSKPDKKTVKKTNLPFYMTSHTGQLRVLKPGVKDSMGWGEPVLSNGQPIILRTTRSERLFDPLPLQPGLLVGK